MRRFLIPLLAMAAIAHAQDQPPTPAERKAARLARYPWFDDQWHIGAMAYVDATGIGAQVAYPLSFRVIARGGGQFYRYNQAGQQGDATYNGRLQLGYARLSLDFFPWKERRFHITPLVVFANQTHATASFDIAPGETFDLEDGTFYTTAADSLRGAGRVDLRKTSPGLALGFGNLSHGHGHWVFPVEFGFYYAGTPKFQINFTGTVCSASRPPITGCQSVDNNPQFQQSLQQLRNEVDDNLHYGRFIPILNIGIGRRF